MTGVTPHGRLSAPASLRTGGSHGTPGIAWRPGQRPRPGVDAALNAEETFGPVAGT